MNDITHITLDENSLAARNGHECQVAMQDLIADNSFTLCEGQNPPYHLALSLQDERFQLACRCPDTQEEFETLSLSVRRFRRIIQDYLLICESYDRAVLEGNPSRIEAIDMGRRGIHNEGSELVQEILENRASMNFETARRIFTLLCALHQR